MDNNGSILALATSREALRTVADLVRTARQRRNWTLKDLSGRSGIPESTISRLERTGLASTDALFEILFALDELSVVKDCMDERLRQNRLPRSLDDLPDKPRVVLRVRHGKGDVR